MSKLYNRPGLSRARRRAMKRRLLLRVGAAAAVLAVVVAAALLIAGGSRKDKPVSASNGAPAPTQAPDSAADILADDDDALIDDDDILADDDDALADDAGGSLAALSGDIEPTPAPTPAPDSALTGEQAARAQTRPTPTAPGFLPIFEKAETEEKIIAITVDDCFQADNLQKIVDTAIENGGKLTIFPIGQNVIKKEQSQILKYAWENGFELENHTYTHSGLFKCSDEELAQQVYLQQMTLCHILDQEYQCHFLRPRGGDARRDQRMHKYAEQMGYYGIAHWSCAGSTSTDQQIAKALKPGAIYLFHTTNNDWDKLERFIPWAVQQGYRLVTLNEMFGYPPNETAALTAPAKERPVPTLAPYERVYVSMKKTTYSYTAWLLQEKLIELGYLTGEPDGVYGEACAAAISAYQRDHGMEVNGVADPELQRAIIEG